MEAEKKEIDILINGKSLQAMVHNQKGGRIDTFLKILEDIGFNPVIKDISYIKEKKKQYNFRGIASLTRSIRLGYTDDELKILRNSKLVDFIAIFANHPPYFTIESNKVAEPYYVRVLEEHYGNNKKGAPPIKIKVGEYEIVINNSCKIECDKETYIRMGDLDGNNRYFLCYCKKDGWPTALFIADSGFLCESNSNIPGPGLIGKSDNKKFICHWFKELKNECKKRNTKI